MSHLSLETLARLVDEAPSAVEATHLELCAACRQELGAMRADAAALASLPDIAPPAGDWGALQRRLTAEGLMATPRPNRWATPLLRMAAGVVLFAMGTGTGLFIAATGDAAVPPAGVAAAGDATPGTIDTRDNARLVAQQPAERPAEPAAGEAEPRPEAEQPPVVTPVPQPQPPVIVPDARRPVRLASTMPAAPRSSEEALSFMREAESRYLEALTQYAELTGAFESGDPAARLAALEGIVLTTRAALGQAPADPIINGYHMTALAQREATLRQIAAASNNTWF